MADIGHSPMSEHPALFNAYLKEILSDITGDREGDLPETLTPDEVGVRLEPSS